MNGTSYIHAHYCPLSWQCAVLDFEQLNTDHSHWSIVAFCSHFMKGGPLHNAVI